MPPASRSWPAARGSPPFSRRRGHGQARPYRGRRRVSAAVSRSSARQRGVESHERPLQQRHGVGRCGRGRASGAGRPGRRSRYAYRGRCRRRRGRRAPGGPARGTAVMAPSRCRVRRRRPAKTGQAPQRPRRGPRRPCRRGAGGVERVPREHRQAKAGPEEKIRPPGRRSPIQAPGTHAEHAATRLERRGSAQQSMIVC